MTPVMEEVSTHDDGRSNRKARPQVVQQQARYDTNVANFFDCERRRPRV